MRRKSIHSAKARLVLLALVIPMSLSAQEQVDRYEVGRALPPLDPGQTLVAMTLNDAISRALESNLDIQSVRMNPQIQEFSFVTARAAFLPTFSQSLSHNNSTNQSTSQLDGGTRTTNKSQSFNTSLSQTLPWYGGRLSASFNNRRSETNSAFSTRNPSYSSSLSFSYSQPLLCWLQNRQPAQCSEDECDPGADHRPPNPDPDREHHQSGAAMVTGVSELSIEADRDSAARTWLRPRNCLPKTESESSWAACPSFKWSRPRPRWLARNNHS